MGQELDRRHHARRRRSRARGGAPREARDAPRRALRRSPARPVHPGARQGGARGGHAVPEEPQPHRASPASRPTRAGGDVQPTAHRRGDRRLHPEGSLDPPVVRQTERSGPGRDEDRRDAVPRRLAGAAATGRTGGLRQHGWHLRQRGRKVGAAVRQGAIRGQERKSRGCRGGERSRGCFRGCIECGGRCRGWIRRGAHPGVARDAAPRGQGDRVRETPRCREALRGDGGLRGAGRPTVRMQRPRAVHVRRRHRGQARRRRRELEAA